MRIWRLGCCPSLPGCSGGSGAGGSVRGGSRGSVQRRAGSSGRLRRRRIRSAARAARARVRVTKLVNAGAGARRAQRAHRDHAPAQRTSPRARQPGDLLGHRPHHQTHDRGRAAARGQISSGLQVQQRSIDEIARACAEALFQPLRAGRGVGAKCCNSARRQVVIYNR